MIYVLQIKNGKEDKIISELEKADITAYAPKHILLERRSGIWEQRIKPIFPGYVFASLRFSPEAYYKIKSIPGVIRIAGSPTPLSVSEEQRLRWLFDAGTIGVSRGYICNGRLIITKGILKGREKDIIGHSIRHKRCRLCCSINGRRHIFSLSAEITKDSSCSDGSIRSPSAALQVT